jgi:DNA-binding response OmpR family regulator
MSAKKTAIIVADDDPQLLRFLVRNLEFEGFEVHKASDGKEALELITTASPDLVILDLMMPRMDGFAVCSAVREFSAVPIIILTALGWDQEKVRAFELGADDYLTKPFSLEELIARVRAVLRRSRFTTNEHAYLLRGTLTIGDVTINDAEHLVQRAGCEVVLSPVEYRLLLYLAQNAGRVVTQDQLLAYIWGDSYMNEGHILQVNISRLRRKLEPDPAHPRYILTKPGVGYMLASPAHEAGLLA